MLAISKPVMVYSGDGRWDVGTINDPDTVLVVWVEPAVGANSCWNGVPIR